MDDKVYYITGNDSAINMNIIVENLLYQYKNIKNDILLIDLNDKTFTSELIKINSKDKFLKSAEYYSKNKIPSITLQQLKSDLSSLKKDKPVISLENNFKNIFIYEKSLESNLELIKLSDEIIVILKKDANDINYVFKFLKNLINGQIESKKINIIISNIQNIEDTVSFFSKVCSEIDSLLEDDFNFNYLGFINFDKERISLSLHRNEVFIQTFPESNFHGCIKFIIEKLSSGRADLRENSLFESILK